MRDMLTTSEVATLRGVSVKTVQAWVKQGRLPGARKVGRDWLIPRPEAEAFQPPPMGRPTNKTAPAE